MSLHYLTLTEQQIEQIRVVRPEFDAEEVEFTGEFIIEDDSFDHEFGTEYVFTPVLTHLEIKLGDDDWLVLINDGDDNNSLITLNERQYEKCLASLQKMNVY